MNNLLPFKPPLGLRGAHVQSLLASLGIRRSKVERAARDVKQGAESLILDGGDGCRLLSYLTKPKQPSDKLAVIIHGWEGSSDSLYVLSSAANLLAQGFRVLRLNLRDHGQSHHLNRDLFHSCRLPETVNAVEDALNQVNVSTNVILGFSLGGNFAMRIAASRIGSRLSKVIAVCPVVEPNTALIRGELHTLIYRAYFYRKWKRSILKKAEIFEDLIDQKALAKQKTFKSLTNHMVTHYYPNFGSVGRYFQGYSLAGKRLQNLGCSSTILMSHDDPVIRADSLHKINHHPLLNIEFTEFGGHCGFIKNYRLDTYIDDFLNKELGSIKSGE
jgi:uncharacterized protein